MMRRTVPQLFQKIPEIQTRLDGPLSRELLAMWDLLGAIVSMHETIVMNVLELRDSVHVRMVLQQLVKMRTDFVIDPTDGGVDKPSTKRQRRGDDGDGDDNNGASGPSTGPNIAVRPSLIAAAYSLNWIAPVFVIPMRCWNWHRECLCLSHCQIGAGGYCRVICRGGNPC